MRARVTAFLALAGLAVGAAPAAGAGVDASLPTVVFVGAPHAPAAVDRVDLARTGRTKLALPSEPVELVRRAVGAGAQAPVVLSDGAIVVALSTPEVVRLAIDGSELSRTRVGAAPAARPPVVLSDGGVALVTTAPSIVFLSRSGKLTATVPLSRTTFPLSAAGDASLASLVPTLDGGVALASGRAFVEVDATGRVRAEATLPERERFGADLVGARDGWLATAQSGTVYRIKPPLPPKRVGTFARLPTGTPALADSRTLLAQLGPGRIAALDLKTGRTVTRVADAGFFGFDGAFVLDPQGALWTTTTEGLLVGYGDAGEEVGRAAVDRPAALPALPVAIGGRAPPPQPPAHRTLLLADRDGRVAFARSGGKVGVRSPDGRVSIATERGCSSPVSLAPVADGKMVLACREGAIIVYGQPETAKE